MEGICRFVSLLRDKYHLNCRQISRDYAQIYNFFVANNRATNITSIVAKNRAIMQKFIIFLSLIIVRQISPQLSPKIARLCKNL